MITSPWRLFSVILFCGLFVIIGFLVTQDGFKGIGCQTFALTGGADVVGVSAGAIANFTRTVQSAAKNFTQTVQALSSVQLSSAQHELKEGLRRQEQLQEAVQHGLSKQEELLSQVQDGLRKQEELQEKKKSLEVELQQLRTEAEADRRVHAQEVERLRAQVRSGGGDSSQQHQQESHDPGNAESSAVVEDTPPTTAPSSGSARRLSHFYAESDSKRFENWPQRAKDGRLPRVLIYTWQTEDTYSSFYWEVYWKACYAHAHGFDLLFTDAMNFTGVKKWANTDLGWYSEEHMWGWVHDIQAYINSGEYDYVFMAGADVLFNWNNLDFPVWQYDRGHDLTLMDDHVVKPPNCFGLNENDVLFKTSDFTRQFLTEFFEYRKGFFLQGDNGPYMETMLVFLGREAEAANKPGYAGHCFEWMNLSAPNMKMPFEQLKHQGNMYYDCFFRELERLAGPYGGRQSKNLGYSPTFFWDGKAVRLPSEYKNTDKPPVFPWANCWQNPRKYWANTQENCFAFHWNGAKDDPNIRSARQGQYDRMNAVGCPDPTFDWEASPYNNANRR